MRRRSVANTTVDLLMAAALVLTYLLVLTAGKILEVL